MAVIFKCLLTFLIVGLGGEAVRVRVDVSENADGLASETTDSQSNILAEMTESQNSSERTANNDAMVCVAGLHTYIRLGDGGCFQHLQMQSGWFQNAAAQRSYAAKFCPFARSDADHTKKRKLLASWFKHAMNSRAPPFAVNDLAMTCLLGDPRILDQRFLDVMGVKSVKPHMFASEEVWSKEEFCETMLSLPLMFESIGFDGPGVLMEDAHMATLWTYRARAQSKVGRRPGPNQGCDHLLAKNFGPSTYARLALRAILPTYFRHSYTESTGGMIGKGALAIGSMGMMFAKSYWQSQVEAVCSSAASHTLDQLFSLRHLHSGGLLSESALHRDSGQCESETPCNYAADYSKRLGPCELCGFDFPFFDDQTAQCFKHHQNDMRQCTMLDGAPKKTCSCHKAICWYFTGDFEAALQVANKVCGKGR